MKNPTQRRVFLIGLRGVGKTTLARRLGKLLGWPWLDADQVLAERQGRTIESIFADDGEVAFRGLERELMRDLTLPAPLVLATGGGVVLDADSRTWLTERGVVVWLTADPIVLANRLASDPATRVQRPALTDLPTELEIRKLLQQRDHLYRECADLILDTTSESPEQLGLELLKELQCLMPFPT